MQKPREKVIGQCIIRFYRPILANVHSGNPNLNFEAKKSVPETLFLKTWATGQYIPTQFFLLTTSPGVHKKVYKGGNTNSLTHFIC